MNKTAINLTIGFMMVCISLTMIPSAINAQTMIPNELQQKYPQPYGMSTQDYMYMMQMMQFYMNMFGPQWQDQVIKIYEDDDDDDDDHDHDDNDKNKDRGDWKKWFKKHYDGKKGDREDWKDKKKYCEGKGSWNGHKCVTNNEKDKADWEDAVCDNKPGSNSKLCGKDDDKKDDENENDKEPEEEQEQPEFSFISDDENENDNDNKEVEEQEGSEESSEPEEQEEQEEDSPEESKDDSSDDSNDDEGN